MKIWYAVVRDNEDNDWGYGSADEAQARKMARDYRDCGYPDAHIVVVEESDFDAVAIDEIYDIEEEA